MSTVKRRVVIIGGGTGGAMLANRLPRDEFEVMVIDKQPYNYFWPWLLYIAFRAPGSPLSVRYVHYLSLGQFHSVRR